jgi:4-hydroxybenzoate polyprenyltransferase
MVYPKYLSHLARNFFIFFILFVSFKFLGETHVSFLKFLLGGLAISSVYAPVYFLNDYFDRKDDAKYKKENLFLVIKNKQLYIFLPIFLGVIGIILSYLTNPSSVLIVPMLYFLNIIYTAPSARLRDKRIFREIIIFIIYSFKSLLIYQYLHQPFNQAAIYLLLLHASIGSFGITLYKRHKEKESRLIEYFFGSILVIIFFAVLTKFPQLMIVYLPVIPITLFIYIFYKKKQFPLNILELGFFIYVFILYLYRFIF